MRSLNGQRNLTSLFAKLKIFMAISFIPTLPKKGVLLYIHLSITDNTMSYVLVLDTDLLYEEGLQRG